MGTIKKACVTDKVNTNNNHFKWLPLYLTPRTLKTILVIAKCALLIMFSFPKMNVLKEHRLPAFSVQTIHSI